MAFLSIVIPRPKIYTSTRLYGVGRAESDAELRANLRLITAVLLGEWYEEHKPGLDMKNGHVFDIATSEFFFKNGFAKSQFNEDTRLWFCTYVGFEKVTSWWAKKNHPTCHGYLSMRLLNQDVRHNELDSHTIQIYF